MSKVRSFSAIVSPYISVQAVDPATVATPAAGELAVFTSTATGLLSFKNTDGTVTPLYPTFIQNTQPTAAQTSGLTKWIWVNTSGSGDAQLYTQDGASVT